jgi:hypothetical protein
MATDASSCLPCIAGSYNDAPGQSSCTPCGSTSTSDANALTCTCSGAHRVFGKATGQCTCEKGYVFFDEEDKKQYVGDSNVDCSLNSEEACDPGEIRWPLAAGFECIDPEDRTVIEEKCTPMCGNNTDGESNAVAIDKDTSGCFCATYIDFEIQCNSTCQANLPVFSSNGDGSYTLTSSTGQMHKFETCAGANKNQRTNVTMLPVEMGKTGPPQGVIANECYWADLCGIDISDTFGSCPSDTRRRRDASDSLTEPSVQSPIMCIAEGGAIAFTVDKDSDNKENSTFPVYDKENALNSNAEWSGYAGFLDLKNKVLTTEYANNVYIETFEEAGWYVFGTYNNPNAKLYVLVKDSSEACAYPMYPSDPETLKALGATSSSVEEAPSIMPTVIAISGSFGGVVILLIVLKILTHNHEKKAKAKAAASNQMAGKVGKPVPTGITAVDSKLRYLDGGDNITTDDSELLLEDFGVKRFYDMLGELNSHVSKELDKHTDELREFYSRIGDQSDTLKKLIRDKANVKSTTMDRARQAAAAGRGGSGRDTELVDLVKNLLEAQWDKANNYQAPSAALIIEEDDDSDVGDELQALLDRNAEGAARAALLAEKEKALRDQAIKDKREARLAAKRAAAAISGGGDDESEEAAIAELKAAGIDFDPTGIYAAANAAERRRLLAEARAKLEAQRNLDAKLRNRLAAKLKMLEKAADADEIEKEILGEAIYDPTGIYASADAAERRRLLAEARARLEAKQQLEAKLRNRLAAKLKALEVAEELAEAHAELTDAGVKVEYDPTGVLSAEDAAVRRRKLQEMRAKLEAQRNMDAKLKNRLAARLKGLEKKMAEADGETLDAAIDTFADEAHDTLIEQQRQAAEEATVERAAARKQARDQGIDSEGVVEQMTAKQAADAVLIQSQIADAEADKAEAKSEMEADASALTAEAAALQAAFNTVVQGLAKDGAMDAKTASALKKEQEAILKKKKESMEAKKKERASAFQQKMKAKKERLVKELEADQAKEAAQILAEAKEELGDEFTEDKVSDLKAQIAARNEARRKAMLAQIDSQQELLAEEAARAANEEFLASLNADQMAALSAFESAQEGNTAESKAKLKARLNRSRDAKVGNIREQLKAKNEARRAKLNKQREEQQAELSKATEQFAQNQTNLQVTNVIDEAAQGKAAMEKHLKQQQESHGSAVKEKLAERKAKAALLASTQEAHEKELEERHAAEQLRLEEELRAEMEERARVLTEEMAKKKEELLRQNESKIAQELEARKGITDNEAQKLTEQAEASFKKMEARLETQKKRNESAIKEKLTERRLAKQRKLREHQQAELRKEQLEQEKERQELKKEDTKEDEKAVMAAEVAENTDGDAKDVIASVLEARHKEERLALEARGQETLEISIKEALNAVNDIIEIKRQPLEMKHDAEMGELLDSVGDMEDDEIDAKRQELKLAHAEQNRKLVASFDKQKESATQEAEMKCTMESNQEALELKETHYQELSDALRDFVPLEVRSSKSVKEMEAQLDLTRKQLEEERAEADAKMEAERLDFESEQKRKMSMELHEFESELAQEREKDEAIEKAKLEELEKRKEELAAERKNRMKQEMEAMEQLQADEQKQILEESKQNITRMEEAMNSEKMRNKAALKAKLAARKKKKQGGGSEPTTPSKEEPVALPAASPEPPTPEPPKAEKEEAASVEKAEDAALAFAEPAASVDHNVAAAAAKFAAQGPVDEEETDDDEAEEDSNDLFTRLCAIEKRLVGSAASAASGSSGGGTSAGAGASVGGPDDGPAYIDDLDAKWKLKGKEPKLVAPTGITSSRFVSFRFGEFIMDLLAKKLGFPKPALLLASSLPAVNDADLSNDYHHNMYRNSFFYEKKSNSLYVRIDRADSVGGMTVMLVHTLAHIALDDMADDRKHAFMKKYHKALEVCCADMFASKALMQNGGDVEKFLASKLDSHSFDESRQVQQRSALVSALLALGEIDESEVGIVEVAVAEHDLKEQSKALESVIADVEDSGGEEDDPRVLAAQNRVNVAEINLEVAKHHAQSMKDAELRLTALRAKQNADSGGGEEDSEASEAAAAMAAMKAGMANKLAETVAIHGQDGEGHLTKEGLLKAASK